MRFEPSSLTKVEILARQLHLKEKTIVNIKDEWKVYMTDDDLDLEVDHFWRTVASSTHSDGKKKYKFLPELAKKALVLPHGNADVEERSLSVNNNVVTVDRPAIGEKTINAIRIVKDIVKFSDPVKQCPQSVPLNNEVYSYVKMAHRNYLDRLQKEKDDQEKERKEREQERMERKKGEEQRKEEREKTVSMIEREKNLSKEEDCLRGKILSTELLLSEGNSKLRKAMEEEDMQCASVAQMMISTATSKIEQLRKEMDILRAQQKEVETGKRKMLEKTFESKKQKRMTSSSTSFSSAGQQSASSSFMKHTGKGKESAKRQ